MSNTLVKAWHFVRAINGVPTYYHGKPAVEGERLECVGELVLCNHGYHASREPLDALKFAPGPYACLVEVGGDMVESVPEAQLVARWRRPLWIADASDALRRFAKDCAVNVAQIWGADDRHMILAAEMESADACLGNGLRGCKKLAFDAACYGFLGSGDPVSDALLGSLCARIAAGLHAQETGGSMWGARNYVWRLQNTWLDAHLRDLQEELRQEEVEQRHGSDPLP